jgi:hypothetical protein
MKNQAAKFCDKLRTLQITDRWMKLTIQIFVSHEAMESEGDLASGVTVLCNKQLIVPEKSFAVPGFEVVLQWQIPLFPGMYRWWRR